MNNSNWPTELDMYYMAYEWVGSSPCEDCDNMRKCFDEDRTRCDERLNWDNACNARIRELTKLYYGEDK